MRALILSVMVMGSMIGTAAAQDGAPRGRLFISPMGEPFRGDSDGKPPQDQWFDGADANHDGVLTVEEMTADGARFFATLDLRKDGEIDPDDITQYETVLVPEIWGSGPAGNRAERKYFKADGSGARSDGGFGSPRTDKRRTMDTEKKGAARFGYLDYPQPIIVADRNFNRGVDSREWAKAAETRFEMLDSNGDGRIEKDELPKLPR